MYLLYMKGCYYEYFVGGEILLENLDLVSSFKIKWKNTLISSQSRDLMSNNLDLFSKHETEGNKISILSRMLKLPLVILWEVQLFKVAECGRCWARAEFPFILKVKAHSTHIYVRIIYVYIYI